MAIAQETDAPGYLRADKHPIESGEVLVMHVESVIGVEGSTTPAVCRVILAGYGETRDIAASVGSTSAALAAARALIAPAP